MIQYFSDNLVSRRTIVSKHNDARQHWMTGSYPRGGIWGMCPPLEPNGQRKNLRRLNDLRGPIQRKSPKLSTWFFLERFSWVYSSIWDKKKRHMWTKSMFTSCRCVCFFSSRRTSLWPESLHKSLILAKFLSRERALSFPFIAFLTQFCLLYNLV